MRRYITALLLFMVFFRLPGQDFGNYGWTFYDTLTPGISYQMVNHILRDEQGNVWATFNDRSLSRFSKGKWTHFTPPPSPTIEYGSLRSMVLLPDDQLLICGINGKLYGFSIRDNTWSGWPCPGREQILEMAMDSAGTILMAGHAGILYQYFPNTRKWKVLDNGGHGDIFSIGFANNGDALVSYRNGSFRYQKTGMGQYSNTPDTISAMAFYRMIETGPGQLWCAAYSGMKLHHFEDTVRTEIKNMPEESYYDFNGSWQYTAHELIQLPNRRLILGTQFGAHLLISDSLQQNWQAFSIPLNGEFDGVQWMEFMPDSSIWVATWYHGIAVFSDRQHPLHKKVNRPPQPRAIDPRQKRYIPQPVQEPYQHIELPYD